MGQAERFAWAQEYKASLGNILRSPHLYFKELHWNTYQHAQL